MRHEQILTKGEASLLIIDYQEKLLAAFQQPDAFVNTCIKMIKFARILKLPIIWTEQYPRGLGSTVGQVKRELTELFPLEKTSFSCFGEPSFTAALSRDKRKQLIVCGIETHICIEQTVLDALAIGYLPHVVMDACASRREHDHETGLRKMENAGAVLSCSEMIIYEILERSDSPYFREVLKLVR